VEDHSQLEQSFYGEVERLVRNDSTVQWRGVFYEVPPYLRRQRVRLRYALLDSSRVSVLDGTTEIRSAVSSPPIMRTARVPRQAPLRLSATRRKRGSMRLN